MYVPSSTYVQFTEFTMFPVGLSDFILCHDIEMGMNMAFMNGRFMNFRCKNRQVRQRCWKSTRNSLLFAYFFLKFFFFWQNLPASRAMLSGGHCRLGTGSFTPRVYSSACWCGARFPEGVTTGKCITHGCVGLSRLLSSVHHRYQLWWWGELLGGVEYPLKPRWRVASSPVGCFRLRGCRSMC